MEWFRQLTGGTDNDRASLFGAFGQAVVIDLAPLGKKSPALMKDAIQYVLTGEPEDVLLKIRGAKECGGLLGLLCCRRDIFSAALRLPLQNIDVSRPACYVRLFRVYEAAASSSSSNWIMVTPGVSRWLDIFLQEATRLNALAYGHEPFPEKITADFIEQMLEAAGDPREMMVRAAFSLDRNDYRTSRVFKAVASLKGLHQSLARHTAPVFEGLNHPEHHMRVQALELLFNDAVDLGPFCGKILELACGPAKTVREAAEKIVARKPALFHALVVKMLNEGDNLQRLHSVKLLERIDAKNAPILLSERLQTESAPKVRAAIEAILAGPPVSGENARGPATNGPPLEPLPEVNPVAPLPAELEERLHTIIRNYNEYASEFNKVHAKDQFFFKMEQAPEGVVRLAFQQLQNMVVKGVTKAPWKASFHRFAGFSKELQSFIANPAIQLIHVLRLLIITQDLRCDQKSVMLYLSSNAEKLIQHFFICRGLSMDARTVGAALGAIGIDPRFLALTCLYDYSMQRQVARRPQDYWGLFADYLNILEEVIGSRADTRGRETAFHVLTAFPVLPAVFHAKLWELALEGPKHEKPLAQKCISKIVGHERRLIEALKDGRQDVRAGAARWASDLRLGDAIPELKKALHKEKSDVVKAALMEALETLGVPADEFIDRSSLSDEANKALAKGVPPQLDWFPFDVLPAVRWENGEPVEPAIVQWLIVLGFKLGSPEPSPVIRKYCQFMEAGSRRELGRCILQAWLARDTAPRHTMETAVPEARQSARQLHQWYKDKSEEELFQSELRRLLNECQGSAIKEKGILAVSAACCGPEVVPIVEDYLKTRYGIRVHQCRALVQMLAWNEHPAAIQLLLSVANRFRTRGIQEQASQCVNELAERQGWTLDELADRTIPTAGFDENRRLALDFGKRTFVCRLSGGSEIEIFNEAGKAVKNLPDAGKDDDLEMAKAAKKELSEARKTIKQVQKFQRERLYENMCTQRFWQFADLKRYLFEHPLMSHYCQRLTWGCEQDGRITLTFRPMDDGTLTDAWDGPVRLDDGARIRLAHLANVDSQVAVAWKQHFSDYEIEPLFEQFGQPMYLLTEADQNSGEIASYLGYMLDNFKLRGVATKRGYTRGQALDGGVFFHYRKRFPGLKLEAVVEFTGSQLPEENVRVALRSLYFVEMIENEASDYYGGESRVALEDIPSVLLSECWNDLRCMAEAGEGFVLDWEKKVAF